MITFLLNLIQAQITFVPKPVHKLLGFIQYILVIAYGIMSLHLHFLAYAIQIAYVGGIAILFLFQILLMNYLESSNSDNLLWVGFILFFMQQVLSLNHEMITVTSLEQPFFLNWYLLNRKPLIQLQGDMLYLESPLYQITITFLLLTVLIGVIFLLRDSRS